MTEFNPGPEWQKVDAHTPHPWHGEYLRHIVDGIIKQIWVREKPVTPLPVEPYTVIRVRLERYGTEAIWVLLGDGGWHWVPSGELVQFTEITGFEVLSEPTPRVALYEEQERVIREQAKWALSNALMAAYDNGTSPNAAREAEFVLDELAKAGLEVRQIA